MALVQPPRTRGTRKDQAVRAPRRAGGAGAWLLAAALPALGLAHTAWAGGGAIPAPETLPRLLLVTVSDHAPAARPAFQRGRDNSYTVSTGNGGDRDDRADAPANGTLLSTTTGERRLRVREGEAVRVELPTVQSLQFHVPMSGAGAARGTAAAAKSGASAPAASAPASAAAGGGGPAVSGIVYFDSVGAFAARFGVRGTTVYIHLKPLRGGTVSAPYPAAPEDGALIHLQGRLGAWIPLGDPDVAGGSKGLSPTATPVSPASTWVRVELVPADQP